MHYPNPLRQAEPPSRPFATLGLLTALLLSACLDDTPFGATGPDDRGVGVIPATLFLEPGSSVRLQPTAGLQSAGTVRWESSNPQVAAVQDDGTVTAGQVGVAEVRAWNNRGAARSTVTVLAPAQRVRSWRIAREGLTESSLLGYWSADAQTSFAVGTGSTILRTGDGGLTWSKMEVADTVDLVSVWGTSPNNVYAVGTGGTILHYDGVRWSRMPVLTDRALLEVWGLGPNEIYAVGFRTALRYDGTAWRPLGGAETAELWAVWGSDPANIFAVGQDGVILRMVGGQFVPAPSPTNLLLLGLWGTGPESIFAVGIQGLVLRWDGSTWTAMPTPTRENLFALWGKSGDDIVAVGDNGTIIHFNGAAWSLLPQSASGENLRAVHAAPNGVFGAAGWDGTVLRRTVSGEWAVETTSPLLFDAARFSGQLYAVGAGGAVLRESGTGWNPLPIPAKRSLFAVIEDQGTLLAVGDAGTIARYNGTGWQDESYPARWLLRSIWIAPGSQDGFIVGDRGLILHRAGAGGRWVEVVPPVERFLRHVWGLNASQVYAVGDNGAVLTWTGGSSWKLVPTPTDSTLRSIWGSGPGDLFAVGTGGTILRYDGVRWYSMASPTEMDLRSVWGAGPTEVYAAGEDGLLLQFDGARWTTMSSPTEVLLLSIEANPDGVPVVVGARGTRLEGVR